MKRLMLLLTFVFPLAAATAPDLDMNQLAGPLRNLKAEEQSILDEAIQLIQKKEHSLAFLTLSRLVEINPKNSSLHVMRAFVLLQLGNLAGALDDARNAESSGPRSAYRCWFLARLALMSGNEKLCRRELSHVSGHPTYGVEAEQLRRGLAARK